MLRGLLGLVPFVEHQRSDPLELGILLGRADVARQFEPVAAGVEEID